MIKKLSTIFLSFIFIANAQAQVIERDIPYQLDDFSQGLNTKISQFGLQKNEGDIVENLRFDDELKSLTKREKTILYGTADSDNPILGLHRLYLTGNTKVLLANASDDIYKGNDITGVFTKILTVATPDHSWQWLTWHNLAIGTDGYNQPVKYDGTSTSATYLGTLLATGSASAGNLSGDYTYEVACYTASYSASLGTPSNTITVSSKQANLSQIPLCPDTFLGEDIVGRKVYRTVASGSVYKLLSNGTIADNSTTTLTDNDADGSLGATLSPTETDAPPKGRLSIIHKNRLWIANNPNNPSRIYYSEDGTPDFFLSTSYFDIRKDDGDEITFVKNLLGKLTIGKNNTIQKIYTDGDDPDTEWEISDPFSFVGSHAIYSAVNTPIGLIYLSNNGLYVFNGQNSQLISDQVTPEIKDITPSNFSTVWGEYFKNHYYMAYTSNRTGSSTNNRVLILDLITKAYSIDLLNVGVFHVFRSGTDVESLYSGSSTAGKVYAHADTLREIIQNKHSDFTGDFDDMRFIPVEFGGDANNPILELSWDMTPDSVWYPSTIDSMTGCVDRPDTDGKYTSDSLTVNASRYDKLYWNEVIPAGGGDVTFAIRSATADSAISSASWSSEFTLPTGSDISGLTANNVVQYRISMSSNTCTQTPEVIKQNGYNIRLTYNIAGVTDEISVPIHYRTGWIDLGRPGFKKTLRKLYAYYEYGGTTGTLDINVDTLDGANDEFAINLANNPSDYTARFTGGGLTGEFFRFDIQETSLNTLKIKKILCTFDTEPLR